MRLDLLARARHLTPASVIRPPFLLPIAMRPDITAKFPADVRARGLPYYMDGRVIIADVADGVAIGQVLGLLLEEPRPGFFGDHQTPTKIYTVAVTWMDDGDLAVTCTCPFFDDRGPCKHLWAMLLHLEATSDFLESGTPSLPSAIPTPSHPPQPRHDSAPARQMAKPPTWKRTLAEAGRAIAAGASRTPEREWTANRRINYIIDAAATLGGAEGLVVELATQTLDRHGSWGPPRLMMARQEEWLTVPDPLDRQIAQMLLGTRAEHAWYQPPSGRRYAIAETSYDTTLRLMCETGRCRIRTQAGEPQPAIATWDGGEQWELVLEVVSTADSDGYLLVATLRRNEARIRIEDATLLLRGGLVIANNLIAPLRHFGAFDLIPALGASRRMSIAAGDVPDFLATLYALPHVPRVLLPAELAVDEIRTAPVARVAITPAAVRGWGPSLLECELAFDYGGTTISRDHRQAALFHPEPPRIIHRDPSAERGALDRLLSLGISEQVDHYPRVRHLRLKPSKLDPLVRTLVSEGWHVEIRGQRIRTGGALTAEVRSGIDWFELDASVAFGDSTASLPALLAALDRGDRTVSLPDGTLGLLADDAIARLRSLAVLGKEVNGGFRFGRTQVALLDTLLSAMPATRVDDVFERARGELRRFDRVAPSEAPAGFHGTLRPYQKEGLGWLHFLRDFGFGGCLADDMGLGKTVQLLALLEARREASAGPSLVVVPKSLLFNWRQESARFAPALRVLEYAGGQRGRAMLDPQQHDLVLTTYGVLRRDAARLATISFDYVVLDEAQVIKNATTAGAKAARSLTARHRLALTGTPVENRLGDLWSLFEFLNPGMLGAARALKAFGSGTGEGVEESRTLLARALRPFILRRTKQQVAKDLPERLEQTIYVELESKERAQYDELRDHYRASLLDRVEREGMNKSRMHILEALLRLRQAACHPGLIDKRRVGESSSKLEVLVPRLLELAAEDHKTLVFSQFTSMLAILRSRLDDEGLSYAYLDGRTRDREARVAEFQNDPSCRTFLISLKAGGLGLNLTAAEYVFLLDPWWNPAVEAQAIDRAHRIGQTRRVFASRLIARDTVEEKVLELQRTKRELADAIITGDNASVGTLRREDLEALLS